ncbi:MAG: hypothetical protein J0I12_23540 [Candidatus Eremiobacteraeota bacterium]|nr:hypothetical protein [Candidatus Eremiobacteraeota bacterium]
MTMQFTVEEIPFELSLEDQQPVLSSPTTGQELLCAFATLAFRQRPVELLDGLWNGRSLSLPEGSRLSYQDEQARIESNGQDLELDRGFLADVVLEMTELFLELVGQDQVDWVDDLCRAAQEDLGVRMTPPMEL